MSTRLLHNVGSLKHEAYTERSKIEECADRLTFDGVYLNVWENRDILKDRDPILFTVGAYQGLDNSWDEGAYRLEKFCTVEQLQQIGGEIGWHTWTHPDLTTLDEGKLIMEITPPWPMRHFAYPYGRFNDKVIEAVKAVGFTYAWSVGSGDDSQFQRLRKPL